MVYGLRFKHGFLVFILVSSQFGGVFSKGGGSKGGHEGGGGAAANSPAEGLNPSKSVKNVGRLANRNWLIYGPILVCIVLITMCVLYDKFYRCYLSRRTSEREIELKPVPKRPALIVESPPSTRNSGQQMTVNTASAIYSRNASAAGSSSDHSGRQQLAAAIQKQENDDVQQIYHVEEGRKISSADKIQVQPYQVGVGRGGLSEAERLAMTRRLAEKIQESSRRNWIIEHEDAIKKDGIRFLPNSHFVGETQSAAVLSCADPLGHLRSDSQAGLRKSGSETSASQSFQSHSDSIRVESVDKHKLYVPSPNRGRIRSERTPVERRLSRIKRSDARLDVRAPLFKDEGSENSNTVSHPLID